MLGVSLVKRASQVNEIHGLFILLNEKTGVFNEVLKLDYAVDPANPRGGGRGFRGVTQDELTGRIFIADFVSIRIISYPNVELAKLTHPAMRHIHSIVISNNVLWAVSTANDTVFGFDIHSLKFIGAWEFSKSKTTNIHAKWTDNPIRSVSSPGASKFHLNALFFHKEKMWVSGLRTEGIIQLSFDGKVNHILGPLGSHDIIVQNGKIVLLDTAEEKVLVSREDNSWQGYALPHFNGNLLEPKGINIPQNIAKPWFLRGLTHVNNNQVALGHTPASVILFNPASGIFGKRHVLSYDIRWMVSNIYPLNI